MFHRTTILFSFLAGISFSSGLCQADPGKSEYLNSPVSNVSVLSIHVSDTIVHDSVFHFLADALGLAVEYYPEKWGDRKYAGLHAGNIFLEPCGPFRGMKYSRDQFKAVFYGLNCEFDGDIDTLARFLTSRNIHFSKNGAIRITDSIITGNNLFFNIVIQKDPVENKELKNPQGNDDHLICGIKEIWIGLDNIRSLERWNELLYPQNFSFNDCWKINHDQYIRFVRNDVTEIKAIVFKVLSINQTSAYLDRQKLPYRYENGLLRIDNSRTFELEMYFSE